ncbi:hypothetical protein Ddc_13636 [Ditylenchus destructor]|nr:hypothetical protein Ddc_13636 [Ditylenchus destructor]
MYSKIMVFLFSFLIISATCAPNKLRKALLEVAKELAKHPNLANTVYKNGPTQNSITVLGLVITGGVKAMVDEMEDDEKTEVNSGLANFFPMKFVLEDTEFQVSQRNFNKEYFFRNIKNLIGEYASVVCFQDSFMETRRLNNDEGAIAVLMANAGLNHRSFKLFRC